MAQAEDYQIADAVRATVNGASLSITPNAVTREYVPRFQSQDLPDGVNVYVVPRGMTAERLTKVNWEYIITTHVAVVRRDRDGTNNSQIDPLRDYAEEIFRLLRTTSYGSGDTPDNIPAKFWRRTNADVPYSFTELDESDIYVSVLALEWRSEIDG